MPRIGSSTSRWVATVVFAAAIAAAPATTWAQQRQQGQQPSASSQSSRASGAADHFKRGVELYDEGDFAGALVEFKRAYEIAPEFRVLYNIGQASFELRDYASAQRAFRRYLDEGGDRVPADRRAQVERDLAQLDGRVALVRIDVDAIGANVFVDGRNVGTSPIAAPVVVNVGPHEVRAEISGQTPLVRTIDVAGREESSVSFSFKAAGARGAEPHAASATGSPWPTIGTVLLASGGVVLAASIVSDLTAVKRALDDFDDKRAHDDPAAANAQSKARTLQTVTLLGYGAGALLAASGAVVLLWPRSSGANVALGPASIAARVRF